jgi:flagellar FliL protein
MAKQQAPQSPTDLQATSGGKLKVILLALVALLLAVGLSIGATWYLLTRGEAPAETAAAAVKPGKVAAVYEPLMPAFVVNFPHQGRQRYLQVSMSLMGRDQASMDALKKHMPLLRNNLVMLLSSQDFEVLSSAAGKELLRQQVSASVQELAQKEVGQLTVEQVLFTNFVLQ